MTTTTFGERWKSLTPYQEQSITVGPTRFTTAGELNGQLAQQLNLHAVQVIGPQAISAAKLEFKGKTSVVLVHCKLEGMNVAVLVRSEDSMLTQLLVRNLQRWLPKTTS